MTRMIFGAMGMVGMPVLVHRVGGHHALAKALGCRTALRWRRRGCRGRRNTGGGGGRGRLLGPPRCGLPLCGRRTCGPPGGLMSLLGTLGQNLGVDALLLGAQGFSSSSRSRRARSSSSRRAFSARRASSSSRSSSVSGLAVVLVIANPSHGKGGSRGAAIAYAYRWNAVYPFDAAAFQHGPHSRKSTHRRDTESAAPA